MRLPSISLVGHVTSDSCQTFKSKDRGISKHKKKTIQSWCLYNMPLFPLMSDSHATVKILKFGTPQTIAIIVLKIEKFDVTLH